ncbi:hypothetical protein COU78_03300 [Candidatus Peregrinibacteria bacterium CG10_big_fil_rev_8_21_14_0_10_49_24]|nr:MAG: hypothetical protein COV83_05120 [Candidatus Peregrinibacteria bacterium CG11_big_fil_rev_8_21_14_0_20_49_14]PIR51149.1 MAG: hypothetical protein COU78_03300 [Candidatus Peregrinibacteria bacterium CG10_big_fil_rev_8_21_14_0_10_49_24]PJA67188.1 MAG: hypothetical protein CO157_05455 [Candidatus Peregrinibacteria bacterium CG_4_9_14_3_um_filter_49_12]
MFRNTQFERFAAQIEDLDQKVQFKELVDTFEFDEQGMVSGAVLELFNGTGLEALRDDFNSRHIQFLQQSDFEVLMGTSNEVDDGVDDSGFEPDASTDNGVAEY